MALARPQALTESSQSLAAAKCAAHASSATCQAARATWHVAFGARGRHALEEELAAATREVGRLTQVLDRLRAGRDGGPSRRGESEVGEGRSGRED